MHYFRPLLLFVAATAFGAVPFIDNVSPPSAAPGSGPLPVTLHGGNFEPGATVTVGGTTLVPASVSPDRITFAIPQASLATTHTANINVVNPGIRSVSNTELFPVTTGTGLFAATEKIFTVNQPRGVATADFNGDGNADVAVPTWCSSYAASCSPGKLVMLPGNGSGAFGNPVLSDVCDRMGGVVVADLNGDGRPDLVGTCEGGVDVMLNDGTGHFSAAFMPVGRPNIGSVGTVSSGDFNGDGKLDLVIAGSGVGPFVFLGNGDGTFAPAREPCPTCGGGTGIVVGDYNGDGKLDFADAFYYSTLLMVFLGDGAGNFSVVTQPLAFGSISATGGDFNHDGKLDLVIGISSTQTAVFIGDGTGHFTRTGAVLSGGARHATTGDFNGDHLLDVAEATDSGGFNVLFGDRTGGFTPAGNPDLFHISGPLATADFNHDGLLDIATIDPDGGRLDILVQTPAAIEQQAAYTLRDLCPGRVCVGTVLSQNGIVAGPGFAVHPIRGFTDFQQETGQLFEPSSINLLGNIVGTAWPLSRLSTTPGYAAAWLPDTHELFNLNSVFGWTQGTASWVRLSGQIYGSSPNGPPVTGLIPGVALTSIAEVTESGVVIGTDSAGAVVWAATSGLQRLPLIHSLAGAFNSAGQVLAYGPFIGLLYTPGSGLTNQPSVSGFNVAGFNIMGQYVGNTDATEVTNGSNVPYLYTLAGGLVRLQSLLAPNSDWSIMKATAINDLGQILALATNGNRTTSVLLSPPDGSSAMPQSSAPLADELPHARAQRGHSCEGITFNLEVACGSRGAHQRSKIR